MGGSWVEADHFFLNEKGEYTFDGSKLKDAHKWCQDSVETIMNWDVRVNRILVSNTFTQTWEMQPYYDLADKYGYRIYSIIVENRHGNSENANIHNVPKEKIDSMRERFQIKL